MFAMLYLFILLMFGQLHPLIIVPNLFPSVLVFLLWFPVQKVRQGRAGWAEQPGSVCRVSGPVSAVSLPVWIAHTVPSGRQNLRIVDQI